MKNETALLFIIDRSGSMRGSESDVIGGFNRLLADQKKDPSPCSVSFVQFDHEYQELYVDVPLLRVADLSLETYVPRGNTALLDAVGRAISTLGTRLAAKPEAERPAKVIVVVTTDGAENASREYRQAQVKEMIRVQQEKYNWTFVFQGANIDAVAAARSYGIPLSNVAQFVQNAKGISANYKGTSDAVLRSRQLVSHGKAPEAKAAFYTKLEQDLIEKAGSDSDKSL